MTTHKHTEIDFQTKVNEIAKALGFTATRFPGNNTYARLISPEKDEFTLCYLSYKGKIEISVSPVHGKDNYNFVTSSSPSIKFSSERDSEAIARDIQRRFLKEATETYRAAVAKRDAWMQNYKNKEDTANKFQDYLKSLGIETWNFSFDTNYSGKIHVKIDDLSLEQAKKLAYLYAEFKSN